MPSHKTRNPHWDLAKRIAFAKALNQINTNNREWTARRKVQAALDEVDKDGDRNRSAPDQIGSLLRGKTMQELLKPYGINTVDDLKPPKPVPPKVFTPARMRARELQTK